MQQQFKKNKQNRTAHNRLGDAEKVLRAGQRPLLKPRNSRENQWRVVLLLQPPPAKRLEMDSRGAGSHQAWGQLEGEGQADPCGDRGGGDNHHASIQKVLGSAAALFCP